MPTRKPSEAAGKSPSKAARDHDHMQRALHVAMQGQGFVEPNPMVGCVIAVGDKVVAEGWHERFGGPHAEVMALRRAGSTARRATMYVTLEPCCHEGKTPPCTDAVIAAGVRRVVVAQCDPFPRVAGGGLERLKAAGIAVEVGLCEEQAHELNAPYFKSVVHARPWVIAKWAMTLDGKIATRAGNSQWISNEASRAVGHRLRGRVDAVLVGRRTVLIDDPLLTARPAGPRVATRIVLDSRAAISLDSQLVRTASVAPVLIAAGRAASEERISRLKEAGCDVFVCDAATHAERLGQLLAELGRRQMTNVLVEGGTTLLGSFFDANAVDEVHAFIAPKIAGGGDAPSAVDGCGVEQMNDSLALFNVQTEIIDGDVYLSGRLRHAKTLRAAQSKTTA